MIWQRVGHVYATDDGSLLPRRWRLTDTQWRQQSRLAAVQRARLAAWAAAHGYDICRRDGGGTTGSRADG
jgi:hypothetical protein